MYSFFYDCSTIGLLHCVQYAEHLGDEVEDVSLLRPGARRAVLLGGQG